MKKNFAGFLVASMVLSSTALAKLKVVASTADIAALARVVGGDDVKVTAIAKGSQDPHYIEAKPSFMIAVRDADLLITNGLSLEVGWIPSLVQGARNPKVNVGSAGFLDLGSLITPIDLPTTPLTRAMGDVHPDGNPHFTLDPIRMGQLALKLSEKLSELDAANKEAFTSRAEKYNKTMIEKTKSWQERINKVTQKNVVTYHASLDYFLNRFGLKSVVQLENKPGIAPTAKHILDVISLIRRENIKIILVDNFFDTKIADRVVKETPGVKVASVGIAVDSMPTLKSIEDVIEQLVRVIESTERP